MISKELLSEILPFGDINSLISYGLSSDGNILLQYEDTDEIINIYELASKCKEWATENKYTILTENMHPNGYFAYVLSNKESIENYGYLKAIKDIPHNKTEPEAIFAACQWILENK